MKSTAKGGTKSSPCRSIADAAEILEYLTQVLREENEEKKPGESQRLKAAELLGKRYGLFSERFRGQGGAPAEVLDDLGGEFPEECYTFPSGKGTSKG